MLVLIVEILHEEGVGMALEFKISLSLAADHVIE
jgi:hypothetical protein